VFSKSKEVHFKIIFGLISSFKVSIRTYWACGPGSSVDIATDYGLDGPESNPSGEEISHPPDLP